MTRESTAGLAKWMVGRIESLAAESISNPGKERLEPLDTTKPHAFSVVLRKHQPLSPGQAAALLERSRSQSKPTPEDDAAVEQAFVKCMPSGDDCRVDTNIVASATFWRGKTAQACQERQHEGTEV
jgi:hypothetical protein